MLISVSIPKGQAVSGQNPDLWRKDKCGAWIGRNDYGNHDSEYGWEIDHIDPDGPDDPSNLRPIQWQNYLDKSDGQLKCNIVAVGGDNVDRSR